MASTVFTEVHVKMLAQLSQSTQQAYQPFYDGHAAGLCFAPQTPQRPAQQDNRTTCERMADNAQEQANDAIRRAGGNFQQALRIFDEEYSRLYVGRSMRSFGDVVDLARNGPVGRTIDSALWGQGGFQNRFREAGATGNNQADQTHHFVGLLSAGINGRVATAWVHNLNDNAGDIRLTNAAMVIGRAAKTRPDRVLPRIGEIIRRRICGR